MTASVPPPRLRIELSGRPRLAPPDGPALPLEPHDAALLALVALEGPVSRDRVLALIWPDCSRKTAQGNLRQRLFRLRRKSGLELVVSREALTLAPGVEHDLATDRAGVGGFLGDLHFDQASEELAEWVDAVRQRRHREGSEQLAAEASRLEAAGRLAEAIEVAERLIAREPALEHAHRRTMRLHYLRGDRGAALQAYRRCRASLDQLLGAAPSRETEALAATIERSGTLPEPSPAPPPVTLLRPPRLIGRAGAWSDWEMAWRRGAIVVISGEPGIGKTRLIEDFASAGSIVGLLRAHPGDARMPYTAWSRWLRDWRERFGAPKESWAEAELARLVPGIGAEATSVFAPLRFRQACFDALAGWFGQGLAHVVIDDVQYADEASLETLLAWCSQTPKQRVAIAVRSHEVPKPLEEWLDAQRGREQVHELTLGSLEIADVRELVESLDLQSLEASAPAPELARSTGGNPFFVIELLRAARGGSGSLAPDANDEPLRASSPLSHLLHQRLMRLSAAALRLARVAGLAGTDFDAELAAQTLGVQPIDLADAWAELENTQIFRQSAFAHDLMSESAARSVPAALAKLLHGAIARALDPARVPAARIAHHAFASGDWAFAASQFEAAATDAFAAARHREAVELYDRAHACRARCGDARAAFRLGCRTIESAVHVENEAALEARMLRLMQAAQGDAERLAADFACAKVIASLHRLHDLIPVAERALGLARRLGDDEGELTAAGLLAAALCGVGRHQEGIDLVRGPAERYEAMEESAARCDFASAYTNALIYAGHAAEAAVWSERTIRSGERLGHGEDLAVQWANRAIVLSQVGRMPEAIEAGRRSVALHARNSEEGGATPLYAWAILGNCVKRIGEWQEAEDLLTKALSAARAHVPPLVPVLENHVATLYLELGQYARARQALATPAARTNTAVRREMITSRLDAVSGSAGAERLMALMTGHRYDEIAMTVDGLTGRLAVALAGPADAAVPICRELWVETERLGLKAVALAAAARLASASHELGSFDDAASWARLAGAESSSVVPHDMDGPELAWHLYHGLLRQATDEAMAVARQALVEAQNSLPRMPEAYREGYWHRSPFVPRLRALVAGAGR